MAGKLLAHLRQQWIGVIALLLVLTGGTAYALDGSNTVFTDDIVNGEVRVTDIGQAAVATDEIGKDQVRSVDVRDDTLTGGGLTGADIKDQSGVDTCTQSIRLGQFCFRAENFARPWTPALRHCANLGMYLPTLPQALALAEFDLPDVDTELFWTGDLVGVPPDTRAWAVTEGGAAINLDTSTELETVCVTTPTN